MKTRILLISDIGFQIDHFRNLFEQHKCAKFAELTAHCSPGGEAELAPLNPSITALHVRKNVEFILQSFDLIISYHCRQLFPAEIVSKVRCVNIHPGFNPYNRGWYPGAHSIANGLPTGATIHEIDEKIDNGPIIAQKRIEILPEDTSGTVYPKIIQAEYDLLDEWFMPMITGKYDTFLPTKKGNLNYKKDYYALQELDLKETVKVGDLINRLRALTHAPYQNAYYMDKKTGDKIYVSLEMKRVRKGE
jgi:methionyl-tRNA formyltransferase